MRIDLSEQTINVLAEIISGGSANNPEPSIGLYRQGWRLEAWFKGFGVPFDVKTESRLPATKTAIHGALFMTLAAANFSNASSKVLQILVTSSRSPNDTPPSSIILTNTCFTTA